jgi:hypothetical protein
VVTDVSLVSSEHSACCAPIWSQISLMHSLPHYIQFNTLPSLLRFPKHLVNKANLVHNCFLVYLSFSTCFRQLQDCIYATLGTKWRINTVISPYDGHIAAQNMSRVINILRNKHNKKNCAPSWLYLQDYAGMHGQQNIKFPTQSPSYRFHH